MNLVILSGRLSNEPSLKYLEGSGFAVSKFNLAVPKEYYKNDDKVDFFTVECWNKLAESVANNLDKGRKILVHGYLKQNIWSDENNKTQKNILIVAKRIEFLDYPKDVNNNPNFEPIYYDEESIF
ncbi:MAG: single-stranded DNA-binding protein [Clostridium sp.]|nr:single-stranded DNA-binding protein [Clostridium sp.]